MRSRNSIVIVVALAVVGVAWSVPWTAQANCPSNSFEAGQILSYHVFSPYREDTVLIPEVEGPTGFIITDIHMDPIGAGGRLYQLTQVTDEEQHLKFESGAETISFESGIPICKGSSLVVRQTDNGGANMLVTGYTY